MQTFAVTVAANQVHFIEIIMLNIERIFLVLTSNNNKMA